MRLPVDRFAPLAALLILAACGSGGKEALASAAAAEPVTGPAADYPMVIGEPFTIDGVDYKPSDTLNYDAVGYAAIDVTGGERITGSHKTLPLPSYVEVTALESGKTILVRMERRGPMTSSRLVGLSPGALAQLGLTGKDSAAVRVRRVNPPEPERSALRTGLRAPDRMETPKSLLTVLNRKLDQQNGAILSGPAKPPIAVVNPAPAPSPAPTVTPKPAPKPVAKPVRTPTPPPVASPVVRGSNAVQVAAFSTEARAKTAAAKLGGAVVPAGRLWRVRMGPFASPTEAQAALAKARAAGYSDARIQRAD
jgi:rare lipoprotein A